MALPTVDDASAVAAKDPEVAILIVLDDTSAKLAVPPKTWAELASLDAKAAHAIKFDDLSPLTKIARFEGAQAAIRGEAPLGGAEDTETRRGAAFQDDPPPPPEEDKPDDGQDETGHTGTAMALDEGKMGKKDVDRAKPAMPTKRSQAGRVGAFASLVGSHKSTGWGTTSGSQDALPDRLNTVGGDVIGAEGFNGPQAAALLAAPTMKAETLVKAIGLTEGVIAVNQHGVIRALRIQFTAPRDAQLPSDDRERWIEVRVKRDGAAIEVVPDAATATAFTAGKLDIKELATAITTARTKRKLDASIPVDVLVDGEVDAQELVDVLVALEAAGVQGVGLGYWPPPEQLALRGHRIPTADFGRTKVEGAGVPNNVLRGELEDDHAAVLACYTAALATTGDFDAKLVVSFDGAVSGKVSNLKITGAEPALATCVANALATLSLPKLKDGKVHVTIPLTLVNH